MPQLQPKDIVLLDNLPAQGASQIERAVADVKAKVLWLPSYSPDFSPIENCWSKIKALVGGKQPRTVGELNRALTQELKAVTVDDIEG